MEGRAYLPLVSGSLIAHAMSDPLIRDSCEVAPFLFAREPFDVVMAKYPPQVDVAAFSVSLWNEQLSLQVAERVKSLYPECLVVFGGCQIPFDATDYLRQHPFIDLCARGEGEQTFTEILRRRLGDQDYGAVRGITTPQGVTPDGTGPKELDVFPSPYLTGAFESLIAENPGIEWQAIIETNRGCPFACSFCYWGNALNQKYRLFSIGRVNKIIEWCAQHRIRYIFNADSNFGMLKRDQEIVEILKATKRNFGYPEKFRTCWGKNSDEKIYSMALRLHQTGLDKGLTLARQSHDPETLKNIHRSNIRLDAYTNMQQKANSDGIPVYSELILGLPGETKESFKRGVEEILQSGISNQLFIYHAELLPNTEMSSPEHRKKFGLVGQRIPLRPTHTLASENLVEEYDEIVVATDALPAEDWRYLTVWSWVLQALHGMKLGYFLMKYTHEKYGFPYTGWVDYILAGGFSLLNEQLRHLWAQAEAMQRGEGKGQYLSSFGEVYWEEEEAFFLRVQCERQEWDEGLKRLTGFLCDIEKWPAREALLHQADYQSSRIPRLIEHYAGDKKRYAKEVILYGRKSGTNLVLK